MKLAKTFVAPFLVILRVALPARASDEPPAPAVGTRVRVTTSSERIVGEVLGADAATLRVGPKGGQEVAVRRGDIVTLEHSLRRGRRRRGAGIGFLAGVAAGVVIGATSKTDTCNPELEFCLFGPDGLFSKEDNAIMSAILLAPLGALVGAAVAPGEKWEPWAGPSIRVGVAPLPGRGLSVRVAVAF